MRIPDELLSAFVKGELTGAERLRVEKAIARDRRIAQRVARQRDAGSPRPTRTRFSGSAQIINLAQVRAERAQTGRHRRNMASPRFMLAAALVIGVLGGAGLAQLTGDASLTQFQDGALIARGALARALTEQLGGGAPAGTHITVSASYRSRQGNYCRSFSTTGSQPMSGLACRIQDQWQLQTLLNGMQTSSTLTDLTRSMTGAPLATEAEKLLRSRDWK